MAQLIGFRGVAPKKGRSGGVSESKAKSMQADEVELLVKRHLASIGGDYTNPAQIDDVIGQIKARPFADSTPTQITIAELEGKKGQLKAKISKGSTSIYQYEDTVNDALRYYARDNFQDQTKLVSHYADVYSDALDKMDTLINEEGRKSKEFQVLKDKYEARAQHYLALNAAMNDPNLASQVDPESLATVVTTNPATGTISGVDIVPVGTVPKGYFKTDVKNNVTTAGGVFATPLFLNSVEDSDMVEKEVDENGQPKAGKITKTRTAKLGSVTFKGVTAYTGGDVQEEEIGAGILKAVTKKTGMWDWLPFRDDTPEEKYNDSVESMVKNGITLNGMRFDGNDLPSGSFSRRGNRLFFQNKDNDLVEFAGEDYKAKTAAAARFLKMNGLPRENLDYPLPASGDYDIAPDGNSRIKSKVDMNYMVPPTIQDVGSQGLSPVPQPSPSSGQGFSEMFARRITPVIPTPGATNRGNIPEDQPESSGGKTFAERVIDKGKSIFSSLVPK